MTQHDINQNKINTRKDMLDYEYAHLLKKDYYNMDVNLISIAIAIICGIILYAMWDSLHIIIKIILGVFILSGVYLSFRIIFSKMLWILLFHYVLSFIFDIILMIILLPRKIFGKKHIFEADEKDIDKIYSDLTNKN